MGLFKKTETVEETEDSPPTYLGWERITLDDGRQYVLDCARVRHSLNGKTIAGDEVRDLTVTNDHPVVFYSRIVDHVSVGVTAAGHIVDMPEVPLRSFS